MINAPDNSSIDYNVSTVPWEILHNKIKLQKNIQWVSNKNSYWISSEDIHSQPGNEYYVIKRSKNSDYITNFITKVTDTYSKTIVSEDIPAATVLNHQNVPVFLFTEPKKIPLHVDLSPKHRILSYSNMETNVTCLQNVCEAAYVSLNQSFFSRYNLNMELHYTDNTIYSSKTSEIKELKGVISNMFENLNLYLSFPVKFATILHKEMMNEILQIDARNSENFIFKIPRNKNRFYFLHDSMPLISSDIRPPFLLQLRNSYNTNNIEINGKQLTCLAILKEIPNSNSLQVLESYPSSFCPYPNQNLQFVITDHRNKPIFLDPNSLLIITLFPNNDDQ
mgnify:FL=1